MGARLGPPGSHIFAAEAAVFAIAMTLHPEFFDGGGHHFWVVDNEVAVRLLIRGISKAEDVDHLAATAQLLALQVEARIWYAWVDTKSTPADGLSRDGLTYSWTAKVN